MHTPSNRKEEAMHMNRMIAVLTLLLSLAACNSRGGDANEQSAPSTPDYYALSLAEAQAIAEAEGISEIDAIREYVRRNTSHGEITEPYDYEQTIQNIYLHSQGVTDKPTALCGNFANLMGQLLAEAGIPFQMVNAFSSYFTDCFQGHAFLQAYNEETGEWEVQDPDYNLFYIVKGTGARASAEELAFAANIEQEIEPCRGQVCGWNLSIPEDLYALFGVGTVQETLLDNEYYAAIANRSEGVLYISLSRYHAFEYFLCTGEGPMAFEDAAAVSAPESTLIFVEPK
jgi:hypothetical protein